MNTFVLLDTGILGLLTNSKAASAGERCSQWLISISEKGFEIRVPEISDYEIRRELLRINKVKGIKRLDELKSVLGYVPLITQTMLIAAQFRAQMRIQGTPTSHDKALDGDVLLAAQASVLANRGYNVVLQRRT